MNRYDSGPCGRIVDKNVRMRDWQLLSRMHLYTICARHDDFVCHHKALMYIYTTLKTHFMRPLLTLLLSAAVCATATAQTTISNSGFETWGNAAPGVSTEPTGWYSNKSGSNVAALGPQTCFQDNTVVHSGGSSVRVENATVPIIGTVVNGNVTTAVVNAPTTTKSDGYIGTRNYSDTTDQRRMAFIGRPDSLIGWYQYTAGAATEQGKIRVILHTGDYYDPETPSTYHNDASANKIGEALFLTPMSSVGTWTRFSVPFTYTSSSIPQYIMVNMTSSADQNTTVGTSKMWIDDIDVVYNPVGVNTLAALENSVKVYSAEKAVFINSAAELADNTLLSVYDLTGKVVAAEDLSGTKFKAVDCAYLPTGVYIYKLSSGAFTKTGKLSIQ